MSAVCRWRWGRRSVKVRIVWMRMSGCLLLIVRYVGVTVTTTYQSINTNPSVTSVVGWYHTHNTNHHRRTSSQDSRDVQTPVSINGPLISPSHFTYTWLFHLPILTQNPKRTNLATNTSPNRTIYGLHGSVLQRRCICSDGSSPSPYISHQEWTCPHEVAS